MRKPLYRYPLRQAAANDEVKAWRESHRENIRCRDAMDISIRHHFDGMHDGPQTDCKRDLVRNKSTGKNLLLKINTHRLPCIGGHLQEPHV